MVRLIAKEVLAHLVGPVGAGATVNIGIEASARDGAPENVVRTASDNCRALMLKRFGFEKRRLPCLAWCNFPTPRRYNAPESHCRDPWRRVGEVAELLRGRLAPHALRATCDELSGLPRDGSAAPSATALLDG